MTSINMTHLLRLEEDFQQILVGKSTGHFAKLEKEVRPMMAELIPHIRIFKNESHRDMLCDVMTRLIALCVRDPAGLVEHIVPRHIDFLQNYSYGKEEDENKQEGASTWWLFRSVNPGLLALETAHTGGFFPFMVNNVNLIHAVRSWIRMQALFFDIDKVENIIELHAAFAEIRDPASEHYMKPLGHNRVNPGKFALQVLNADGTPPKLDA